MTSQNQRPEFDELCDCVGIHLTHGQQQWLDSRKSKLDKESFVRGLYNQNADYHFDADCKVCGGHGVLTPPTPNNVLSVSLLNGATT